MFSLKINFVNHKYQTQICLFLILFTNYSEIFVVDGWLFKISSTNGTFQYSETLPRTRTKPHLVHERDRFSTPGLVFERNCHQWSSAFEYTWMVSLRNFERVIVDLLKGSKRVIFVSEIKSSEKLRVKLSNVP